MGTIAGSIKLYRSIGFPATTLACGGISCKGFPANVNVSAAVSLAGIGPHRTRMRIMCDPTVDRNIHEVEVVGEFGRSFIRIENVPSENHRTGILTYLSNINYLRQISATLVVGT